MNLHVFSDDKFFDPFVNKLEQLNLLGNNKFIVKKGKEFKYIKRSDLVSSTLDSKDFKMQVGDTGKYDKVFLHSFKYDLYKWVYNNNFKELNWMVWGHDLYELRSINFPLFENETQRLIRKVKNSMSFSEYFHEIELILLSKITGKVFSKVSNILTWIDPEYQFAINHVKGLSAQQKYFLYGFDIDIETFSKMFSVSSRIATGSNNDIKCIVGNSGAIPNNHLDALKKIENIDFSEVLMPISYGHDKYIKLLKEEIGNSFSHLNVKYLEDFMDFGNYVQTIARYEVFITNSLRPLGMGNIWMALLMGKVVFMNTRNFMYGYMRGLGLQVYDIDKISNLHEYAKEVDYEANRRAVIEYLSKTKVDKLYTKLFGNGISQHN